MKAKDFDKKFDDDEVDIIDDLDLSTARRPNQVQKRVNVDFPAWMILAKTAAVFVPKLSRLTAPSSWLIMYR